MSASLAATNDMWKCAAYGNAMVQLLCYVLKGEGKMPLLPTPPSQDWESGWEGRCSPSDSEKEGNQGRKLGGDWVPGAVEPSHKPKSCLRLDFQVRGK